jgi:asparagine synthase (glutamine-hydrolysing)
MIQFVALFRLDGGPVRESDLASSAEARDGSRFQVFKLATWASIALVAPADRRQRGDLDRAAHSPRGDWLLFDGRLDNRTELAALAGLDAERERAASDAAVVLAALEAAGEGAFDRIVGPFVVLHIQVATRRVRICRDPIGGRAAFLRRDGDLVGVASRPSMLRALGGRSSALDERSIVRFLALHGPRPGRTFFEAVEEVPLGGLVRFDGPKRSDLQAVVLAPKRFGTRLRDAEYEEQFRGLLTDAVRACLPSQPRVGVLMSGGLDSTAIAAIAARVTVDGEPRNLETFSWVFPSLPESDESLWIDATNRALRCRSHRIDGGELWPLATTSAFQQSADSPASEPFWPLVSEIGGLARREGFDSLLTGSAGDLLWGGSRDWLRDLVTHRRISRALAGAARGCVLQWVHGGVAHPVWNSLGRLVRPDPWRPREPRSRPWLTPSAQSILLADCEAEDGGRPWTAERVRVEKVNASRALWLMANTDRALEAIGLELRHPYRDRRLIEFFLGVPAYLLYQPGETKRLLRRALADRLPELVLRRTQATSLDSVVRRGLGEKAWPEVRRVLASSDALWPRFVDSDWLWSFAAEGRNLAGRAAERVVAWQCYSLERWIRSEFGAVPDPGESSAVAPRGPHER